MSLTSVLGTILGKVSGIITKDIEPGIITLLDEIEHDVVVDIIPLAAAALTQVLAGLAANPAPTLSSDLDLALAVAKATLPKLETAAISATANDLITAVQSVITTAAKAAPAIAPAE